MTGDRCFGDRCFSTCPQSTCPQNDMRWILRTIQLCLCVFLVSWTTAAHASVILKISASNPSALETREIPLKSYLPKGITPEQVINAGELEIDYDVKRNQCYVHKNLTLDPQASAVFEVEIEDIWLVGQDELDGLERKTDALVSELRDTQYGEIALEVQRNIQGKIADILEKQEESLVFKAGPTEHIAVFGLNRETIAVIESSISDLDRLLSVVREDKKTGDFDQTRAAKLLQAQRVKEQILNFGDPEVETCCLVEESLREETEEIALESPETVLMRISFENPSDSKNQVVPFRYFLAKEVHASDVLDSVGLNVGYDFEKNLYYVYNDNVALGPSEVKEFGVTLNNKWAVNKAKLYGLKVYLENLTKVAADAVGLNAAEEYGKQTINEIYKLLRQGDPAELTENYVVSYRNDLVKVGELRKAVQRMEDFLIEGKISPELMVLEQEQLCRDAKLAAEKGTKDILGLTGLLQSRRIKLLAGTIFKGKNLSTADTWEIIYYIIIFLGVISGVFYFVNIRQQKSAMFDPLTGAFSRGYALERFHEELKVAKGGNTKCSLLVMDIDKFKGINDTHGHAVGDSILKEFVIAVRKGIRATDLLGRFGGDEFMIVLPTGEKNIALRIAQGINRIVEGTAVKVSPQLTLSITTSIGIATFPEDSATAEDLFDKADQALYQVKRRGGNGAESFGGNV